MDDKDKARTRETLQRRATVVQDMLKSMSAGFGHKPGDVSRHEPFVAEKMSDVVSEDVDSDQELVFHK